MRKFVLLFAMAVISVSVFAQDEPAKLTVGYWVFMENGGAYRDRVVNEFSYAIENSEEWRDMIAVYEGWEADVHIIISGASTPKNDAYAWSVTYTPIDYPRYTNGRVYISHNSITGMNWVARSAVMFLEEQLYVLLDDLSRGDT